MRLAIKILSDESKFFLPTDFVGKKFRLTIFAAEILLGSKMLIASENFLAQHLSIAYKILGPKKIFLETNEVCLGPKTFLDLKIF